MQYSRGTWNDRLLWVYAILLVWSLFKIADAKSEIQPKGDGDVFPHACVNFSGLWSSDDGQSYNIGQKRCEHLVIQRYPCANNLGGAKFVDIVPDNKFRPIDNEVTSQTAIIRHRWNSIGYGTSIQTSFRYDGFDSIIYEEVSFESVNSRLFLESTYRRIDFFNGKSRREAFQRIFRKID